MSLTLQNKTPFTKGTDDNSSKSKLTLNLNLFFFMRMNDMIRVSRTGVTTSPDWVKSRWQTTVHFPCSALITQWLVGGCCCLQPRFKVQISSFPPTVENHSWREGRVWFDWTLQLHKKKNPGHDCNGCTFNILLAETHSNTHCKEKYYFLSPTQAAFLLVPPIECLSFTV